MEDVDAIKQSKPGEPRYRLSNTDVFVSPTGPHYIDYLDAVDESPLEIDAISLTKGEASYIEHQLQSNTVRFDNQVAAVKRNVDIGGKRVLDIGCGGGLFLLTMRENGAEVTGVELSSSRAHYARTKHRIAIVKRPIENECWKAESACFDVVTLWDVIEHVNSPPTTLTAAVRLLKPGGLLLIDTPCRDSFHHRTGEVTYRLSRGRYPTFLNVMYSFHPFGHKQSFASWEMKRLVEATGLDVLELKKFHELSFPYLFYLEKMFKSKLLAGVALPVVRRALSVLPVCNKMLVIGKKA